MSDSNRGYFIVATVAALFAVLTFGSAESRCQRDQHAYQTRTAKQPGSNEITQFRSARRWTPCLVERAIANPETAETTEHDERDLAAQEGAALWAFWIAVISFFQLGLSGFGLWAILRTLKQGRETIQAARDSVAETRRIGEAQVRAYLTGISVEVGFTSKGLVVLRVHVRNSGQSPARCVYLGEVEVSFDTDKGFERFTERDGEPIYIDIGAGSEERVVDQFVAEGDKWVADKGKFYLSVNTTIKGRDVFGCDIVEEERFFDGFTERPDIKGWITLKRYGRIGNDELLEEANQPRLV